MEKQDQTRYLLLDWFQFTILDDVDELHLHQFIFNLVTEFFGIKQEDLTLVQSGLNGYKMHYEFRNIEIHFHPAYLNKGINFLLRGQGCRDFEDLNLDWKDLFVKIQSHEFNVNRIDLAIDDFSNEYFTLEKIAYYRSNAWIRSRFKTSIMINKNVVDDNSSLGYTIQFGSKASLCEVTFYDKIKERESNGYEVDDHVKYWTRTELRFRHEYALEIFKHISIGDDILSIARGILFDKIQFLQPNKKDSNKSRWKVAKWYLDYLDNVSKLKFVKKAIDTSITRKKRWFDYQVSKSLLQIILSDMITLDSTNIDFIKNSLKNNKELTNADIDLINQSRVKQGKSIFTRQEIESFIQDINDIVLINDTSLD